MVSLLQVDCLASVHGSAGLLSAIENTVVMDVMIY